MKFFYILLLILFIYNYNNVSAEKLSDKVPERVLPITANPPRDLRFLVENDISNVKPLLVKGRRKGFEAKSKIRGLAIMDSTIQGKANQPMDKDLNQILSKIKNNEHWSSIFPGVAALELDKEGSGIPLHLRFSKSKDAIPVKAVSVSDDDSLPVVGVKRVNELEYYNLGVRKIARKLKISEPKTIAIIEELEIKNDPELYKVFRVDSSEYKRYSKKALEYIKSKLDNLDINEVWVKYKDKRKK